MRALRFRTRGVSALPALVLVLCLGWFWGHGGPVWAQEPGGGAPAGVSPRVPTVAEGRDVDVRSLADFAPDEADDPVVGPGFPTNLLAPGPGSGAGVRVEMGLVALIAESMFGDPNDPWRPLSLRTFFTEGWFEPWDYPVAGSGGAPRQGWIGALNGAFFRLFVFQFDYENDLHQNGNGYVGAYTLFAPVSRRFQVRFDVPFIDANKGGKSDTYHGNFGDFRVVPRFLLSESQDLSQVLGIVINTPTGARDNGNGQTSINPRYEFWYGGLPNGWVIRGGTGVLVPLASTGTRTTGGYNLAVGKYWTPHDAVPFGDFVTYVAVEGTSTLAGRGPEYTQVSLTPGMRTHLGNNWFFLSGVQVPVTGPKSRNFAWEPLLWLMKVY